MKTVRNFIIVMSLSILFIVPSFAQTTSGNGAEKAMAALLTYLNTMVSTTAKTLSTLIYQVSPSTPATVTNNAQQIKANRGTKIMVNQKSNSQVKSLLSQNYLPNQRQITNIIASDSLIPNQQASIPFWGQAQEKQQKNLVASGDKNFNFDSLIGPNNYNKSQRQHATNYIKTLNLMNQQLISTNLKSSIAGLTEKQKATLRQTQVYKNYIALVRGIVAVQSMALTNLNKLYAERVVNKNRKSATELRNDRANWRIKNPKWMLDMAKASPQAILREQTLIQAEILSRLNSLQNSIEQQNAMTAGMVLELVQLNKLRLSSVTDKVQSEIQTIQQSDTLRTVNETTAGAAEQRAKELEQEAKRQ